MTQSWQSHRPSLGQIGVQRLHRLLPSDLKKIKQAFEHAGAEDAATMLLGVFAEYVLQIDNPHPIQIDDVQRIALQLKSTGILNHSYPAQFLVHLHQRNASPLVRSAIAEAWGLDLDDPGPGLDSVLSLSGRSASKKA